MLSFHFILHVVDLFLIADFDFILFSLVILRIIVVLMSLFLFIAFLGR
jgi:hypothetical protein